MLSWVWPLRLSSKTCMKLGKTFICAISGRLESLIKSKCKLISLFILDLNFLRYVLEFWGKVSATLSVWWGRAGWKNMGRVYNSHTVLYYSAQGCGWWLGFPFSSRVWLAWSRMYFLPGGSACGHLMCLFGVGSRRVDGWRGWCCQPLGIPGPHPRAHKESRIFQLSRKSGGWEEIWN